MPSSPEQPAWPLEALCLGGNGIVLGFLITWQDVGDLGVSQAETRTWGEGAGTASSRPPRLLSPKLSTLLSINTNLSWV